MVSGTTSREELSHYYDCFVEEEKSRIKAPFWWLRGKEICVQGADVYDEIRDIAFGDSPEELLVWAGLQGLSVAENPVRCQS